MVTEQNGKQLDLSQIKLVACDIDGTLLQGDERVLTPRAISLFSQTIALGLFLPASSVRAAAALSDTEESVCITKDSGIR